MKKLFVIIVLLFFYGTASSEVIFEDKFDSQSDWSPVQKTGGQVQSTSSSDSEDLPSGDKYDYFTIDGSSYTDKGENTLNIDNTDYRGGS